MTPDWLDTAVHWFALPVAIILTLHGIDDLFIDLFYYFRGLWREDHEQLTVARLRAKKPQRIAMMVPAWHESAVIARMLENALTTLDYDPDCFDIFVGTYPNDPDTRQKVMSVAARVSNVHEVVVPHDGPTSKADCLNAVYKGIKRVEAERGVRFEILVMHDSEDVIHPLALRHYNYWVPRCDFVQTPVLPLEIPTKNLVGGTYIDEFTEHHLKDMIVRGRIGGLVPSAGVGSAFARAAFEEIAVGHGEEAFDVESLTEDYEIGLKFRLAGKTTFFACDTVEHERERRGSDGRMKRERVRGIIATREYFPTGWRAAIRQRSRWILGIGFQTWEKVGWKGPAPVLYSLYRDRRALLSHLVALAAYLVVIYCIGRFLHGFMVGHPWYFDRLFWPGTVLTVLVWVNAGFLAWRITIKVATLKRVYGWPHSLMSIVRFPIANVVSFLATVSAAKQYVVHKITKRPLRWKKTDHAFPDMEPLVPFHQKLGDILRTREGLTDQNLARGLDLQGCSGHRLGEVLEHIGAVSGVSIDRAVAMQHALPAALPDPETIPRALLSAITEEEASALGVLPLAEDGGWVIVASSEPGDDQLCEKLSARFGRRVRLAYCGHERLTHARWRAYRRLRRDGASAHPMLLGHRLVFAGAIDEGVLHTVLEEQHATGEHLAEIALRRRLVDAEAIADIALWPLHERFVEVCSEDVDTFAMRRLGYAACAFHDIVPLWPSGSVRRIVSAYPLHRQSVALFQSRLESEVSWLMAPRAQLRAARMTAARRAWPHGIFDGRISTDAAELAALSDAKVAPGTVARLAADATSIGVSPITAAVDRGVLSEDEACRLSASLYLVEARGSAGEHRRGWLPPELEGRGDPSVVEAAPDELLLATWLPDARIARELRALHPERALGWRVHRRTA